MECGDHSEVYLLASFIMRFKKLNCLYFLLSTAQYCMAVLLKFIGIKFQLRSYPTHMHKEKEHKCCAEISSLVSFCGCYTSGAELDQTAGMCSLIWVHTGHECPKVGFSCSNSHIEVNVSKTLCVLFRFCI